MQGEAAGSFIRKGPIKYYQEYDKTPKAFVLSDNVSLSELKEFEVFFTKHDFSSSEISIHRNEHFSILLLLDLIKLMVVAENIELRAHFKNLLEHLKYAQSMFEHFDDMLIILERFELIQSEMRGVCQYYIASDDTQAIYYGYETGVGRPNFRKLLRELKHEIYENGGVRKEILDEKEARETSGHVLEEAVVEKLLKLAPLHYKVYHIPKKKTGTRVIAQPTAELKVLQRQKIDNWYDKFPTHESCMAYKRGENGILKNAQAHQQRNFFYKFDFENFFPSIRAVDFYKYLRERHSFSEKDALELCVIFFRFDKSTGDDIKDVVFSGFYEPDEQKRIKAITNLMFERFPDAFQLGVGAPSSPFVSNVIMHEFDEKIYQWAKSESLIYTRYADDLTFSSETKIDILRIKENINSTLAEVEYPNLQLNDLKQKFLSFKTRVQITGINITPDHKLSIGRKKKREIRAKLHAFSFNRLNEGEINQLRGWLAVAKSLERTFFDAMVRHYGEGTVSRLLKIE